MSRLGLYVVGEAHTILGEWWYDDESACTFFPVIEDTNIYSFQSIIVKFVFTANSSKLGYGIWIGTFFGSAYALLCMQVTDFEICKDAISQC